MDHSTMIGGGRAMEFSFSYSIGMRLLVTPLFAGPRRCTIHVGADIVVVRMGLLGWAFAAAVPRTSITEARRVPGPVWAWGAHGWRGRWLVNGSSRGLVQLTIVPTARGRCMGFPLKVKELTLSLAEPDAFVEAVQPPV